MKGYYHGMSPKFGMRWCGALEVDMENAGEWILSTFFFCKLFTEF